MSRRYQKVQELRPQIRQMLEQGMSQREVAESYTQTTWTKASQGIDRIQTGE